MKRQFSYKVCRDCGLGRRGARSAPISECSSCGSERLIDYVANVNRETLEIDTEKIEEHLRFLESNREKVEEWWAQKRAEQERIRRATEQREAEALRRREAARLQREAEQAEERARQQRERAAAARLARQRTEFVKALSEDYWAGLTGSRESLSDELRDQWAAEYVEAWSRSHRSGVALDRDQALAVGAGDGHALVVARAGSGKTRTLVQRAVFLVEKCGIPAPRIMLLAFNTAAADEMRARLRNALGPEADIPFAMNFHQLAHALVHPHQEIIADDGDRLGAQAASRTVDRVIDELLEDPVAARKIRELTMALFRTDWSEIESGTRNLDQREYLEWSRSQQLVTLGNDVVKSNGEKAVANILFEHGVEYQYERAALRRIGESAYRPDFTILRSGEMERHVIIEYFGMAGDPTYDSITLSKRAFWADQDDHLLIDLYPSDLRVGAEAFEMMLVDRLRAAGVPAQRLSEDEIWRRTKELTQHRITKSVAGFIQRARQEAWTSDGIRVAVSDHAVEGDHERAFLDVAMGAYLRYLDLLRELDQIDFHDLIQRATVRIGSGHTSFERMAGEERGDVAELQHLLIDEYQDFSPQFQRMVDAISRATPALRQFAVGDDWQAINRFAGATTAYFDDFAERAPDAKVYMIPTNYRSSLSVVRAGNSIMENLGTPANASSAFPGRVTYFRSEDLMPVASERDGALAGLSLESIARLRLIRQVLRKAGQDGSIMVLMRSRGALDGARADFLRGLTREEVEKIEMRTLHGSKGLEADYVLILDVRSTNYPLVHPLWWTLRIFGEDENIIRLDERRLLYVGLTRARKETWLLSTGEDESEFMTYLRSRGTVESATWNDVPPISPPGTYLIRIRNRFDDRAREQLKAARFRYDKASTSWVKSVSGRDLGPQLRAITPTSDMVATVTSPQGRDVCRRTKADWTVPLTP